MTTDDLDRMLAVGQRLARSLGITNEPARVDLFDASRADHRAEWRNDATCFLGIDWCWWQESARLILVTDRAAVGVIIGTRAYVEESIVAARRDDAGRTLDHGDWGSIRLFRDTRWVIENGPALTDEPRRLARLIDAATDGLFTAYWQDDGARITDEAAA